MSPSRAYDAYLRTHPSECVHDVQGGDVVRPWCNTPACALCRRRHPVHWRRIDFEPRPRNVVALHGDRKLF